MSKVGIGVDVGGTTVKFGIFKESGEQVVKWDIPTIRSEKHTILLEHIYQSISSQLSQQKINKEDLAGIGFGLPGVVLEHAIVERCVNVGWQRVNVREEMQKWINTPIKCSNDANVAALGELWQGGAKGYSDAVLITLGTGVGAGIVFNQKIFIGKHGLAGEIGHYHVRDEETSYCNCGGRGCLEQIASATGVVKEAKDLLRRQNIESSLQKKQKLSAKDVFAAAQEGDELASTVVHTVGKYLGIVVANLCVTVDPEIIVFGGGLSKAGEFLLDKIRQAYERHFTISTPKANLTLAKLGNDAGIYGAAKLIFDD